MLYSILKPIIRLSLRIYFRRVDVIGQENVPKNGPVIFVANHPSALLDPLIAATTVKRKLHFLAGAEWFGKGLKALFFKKQLNMIPVHRPWLAKSKEITNDDMFEECYKSLKEGKSIIIFPEASSVTVSKIRELKTGAVRIRAGFEEYVNHECTVPIIPIGLSYSNPHEFQSRVVVKIGDPVTFSSSNNTDDLAEIYRKQTNDVQGALKKSIIHVDNTKNEGLVKKVSRLFIDTHRENNGVSFKDKENLFEFDQNVAHAVEHFENTDKDGYDRLSKRIDDYFATIDEIGISDDHLGSTNRSNPSLNKWLFIVLGSLITFPNFILYYIPYQLARSIFKNKIKSTIKDDAEAGKMNNTFTGTLIFSIGMVIFIVWTLLLASSVLLFSSNWLLAIIPILIVYPMMRFSLYYAKIALRLRYYYKGKKIRTKQMNRIVVCEEERNQIVNDLKKYQETFTAMTEEKEMAIM